LAKQFIIATFEPRFLIEYRYLWENQKHEHGSQ
jgi:hypothetical protein